MEKGKKMHVDLSLSSTNILITIYINHE